MGTIGADDIKDYMWSVCDSTVCPKVFTSIPSKIPKSLKSFAVVSTPTGIQDYTDYRSYEFVRGVVHITLFAEDLVTTEFGGEENTALLGSMQKALRTSVLAKNATSNIRMYENAFYEVKSSYNGFRAVVVIYEIKVF